MNIYEACKYLLYSNQKKNVLKYVIEFSMKRYLSIENELINYPN
jgi:hypothetical protein